MDESKDTLKPTLSEKVKGMVWRILVDDSHKLIAVESRDQDNKQVYFSVLNYETGLSCFKEKTLPERWNVSMAHLVQDTLLLKIYPADGNPVSKGIVALNCNTGEVAWERYNIAYQDMWREGLEAYNPDLLPRKSYLLDVKTGNQIDTGSKTPINSPVLLPEPAEQNSIPGWITSGEIIGQVLYLREDRKTFLAFHEKTSKNIRLRLIVFQDVAILLDLILKEDIQKLLPEAFFIVQNHLFCIRGNNEVISYLV